MKENTRLLSRVNRVVYVRNLPFNIIPEEVPNIFKKYGAIRKSELALVKTHAGLNLFYMQTYSKPRMSSRYFDACIEHNIDDQGSYSKVYGTMPSSLVTILLME